MGLDITAYRKLVAAPDVELNEDGEPVEYDKYPMIWPGLVKYTEKTWPGRTDGIKAGTYTCAEEYGFRAGSYGGYNGWRNHLAKLVGFANDEAAWEKAETDGDFPFAELIHFSDCEGVIGPVVSAKLYQDFVDWQSAAEEYAQTLDGTEGTYWIGKYIEWRTAFDMAADQGAVVFH